VEVALAAAKTKQVAAVAALDIARGLLEGCTQQFPSATGISANCTTRADAFYEAKLDLDVAEAGAKTLQTKKDSAGLSAADVAAQVEKLAGDTAKKKEELTVKELAVTKIKKEIADSGCDAKTTYPADSVCGKLLTQLDAATTNMAELKALIAQLARDSEAAGAVLKDKEVTEEKVAEADAATSKDSDDGGGMMMIMAAIVIICCLVVGALVAVVALTSGGGGGGGRAAVSAHAHDVIAFDNPAYADPETLGGGMGGGMGGGAAVSAPAAAADQGLYDEPEFNPGEATNVQGGYLDVQPDEDDDDDNDDSSEASSEEDDE